MRENISFIFPTYIRKGLGHNTFFSLICLLAECTLWTQRVQVKNHDFFANYTTTQGLPIPTQRVAHSSTIKLMIWWHLKRPLVVFFEDHLLSIFRDFSCTIGAIPHKTNDTQGMDELFACLKSIEDGASNEERQPRDYYPRGVCSNSLFTLSFSLSCIICNEGIASIKCGVGGWSY